LRYSRDSGSGNPDLFYKRLAGVVSALGVEIPAGQAHYQHIEYVGAGSIGIGATSLSECLLSGDEGLFTVGFDRSDVDPALFDRLRVHEFIIPAVRDPSKWQFNLLADEEFDKNSALFGVAADNDEIRPLLSLGRMIPADVATEAITRVPDLEKLRDSWDADTNSIKRMTLTSVGLAIGHTYWSRLTGSDAPLSIWLP